MTGKPVTAPAGYVPRAAITFADGDGNAVDVQATSPLPVTTWIAAATSTPLAGQTSQSTVVGPFLPELGKMLWLYLSGDWSGRVTVQRSTNGGLTREPLTIGGTPWAQFTGNAQEPFGEETVAGASYWLDIAIIAGSLAFEVRQ